MLEGNRHVDPFKPDFVAGHLPESNGFFSS